MRIVLALASVLALTAAGCGSSSSSNGCQAVVTSLNNVNTKAAPCSTDGGSSSSSLGSFNMASCDSACSSSSDQAALNNVAACFDQLPMCNPASPLDFFGAFAGCAASATLSMQCQALFNASSGGDH